MSPSLIPNEKWPQPIETDHDPPRDRQFQNTSDKALFITGVGTAQNTSDKALFITGVGTAQIGWEGHFVHVGKPRERSG